MRSTIKSFSVEYLSILDKDGNCSEDPGLSYSQMKELYELMILVRTFDRKALALQRQGRIGTYAQYLGQEAAQVGSAFALMPEDWMVPSYRESAALIVRKTPMVKLFQYWGGDERGSNMDERNLPIAIPVGSQPLHAAGLGMASNIKKEKFAALTYFGDGASSKGDVYEAMNFAGVFNTPTLFFCQNNQWAISYPRSKQTKAETIAQKAIGVGIPSLQIDGNDIFAVYKATKDALDRARSGGGPTFIEAYTYRMANHTTSDDSFRYRSKEEVAHWEERDPPVRLLKFLKSKNLVDDSYEKVVQQKSDDAVEKAVKEFEALALPHPDDFFTFTYAEMPEELKEQLNSLKE